MPIATINNYTLGFSYTTFTWPSSPSWVTDSTYGYHLDVTVSGITGGSGSVGSCPVIDVLIPTAASKATLENAFSAIIGATCPSNNTIRFYCNDTTTAAGLAGATIQVVGF